MIELSLQTRRQDDIIDITRQIAEHIDFDSGFLYIYCPHTTAGLMINENADPYVKDDIIKSLNDQVKNLSSFRHMEGNSAAHVKSALVGKFLQVAIENGKPVLGTWDGIMFCEFDGPRRRRVLIKKVEE
ncbi:MAG: secondary thiamine-phosphate synthase enzyme YjbQ [Nanoarchaeota archaeon]